MTIDEGNKENWEKKCREKKGQDYSCHERIRIKFMVCAVEESEKKILAALNQ